MAEFCLECWNKLNNTNLSKKDVFISKDFDICEQCGKIKPVIVKFKKFYLLKKRIERK